MSTTYAIPNGRTVMDATLYTGNGATQTVINADKGTVGFKPDLVWVKCRSTATQDNTLVDSVRGVYKTIRSNTTGAELTETGFNVTAFNTNGFTVIDNAAGGYNVNGSVGGTYSGAAQYVGWQWQAGQGTTSNNTSGTITSTVSANTTAGFSIVTYTGTGANATVGHGLGATPQMLIVKNRLGVYNWRVWHTALSGTQLLYLNATDATVTNAAMWNSTTPTSSVFSLGTNGGVNNNGDTFVAYCWTPIAGFSAFGSYTGNGSADGPFVYTGFRPKFLMIKNISDGGAYWGMWDSTRDPYNVDYHTLFPNVSDAEVTNTNIVDFLSNGFKIRTTATYVNTNAQTVVYMAFAENPMRYANAR